MKYFFLFLLIFLIDHGNVEANCTGYCENENFENFTRENKFKLKGKKKTIKVFNEMNMAIPKNSYCDILFVGHTRLKSLKKDKNSKPIFSDYLINSCNPCTKNSIKTKDNKSGLCPFPMFRYEIIYKKFFKSQSEHWIIPVLVEMEKMLEKGTIIGRSVSGDVNDNVRNASKNIHTEILQLAISPKKYLIFFNKRAKDWSGGAFGDRYGGILGNELTEKKFWFYMFVEYKTAAMEQIIKASELSLLEEEDRFGNEVGKPVIEFVENFINEMQNKSSNYFSTTSKDHKDISKLLTLIPTKKDLSIFDNELDILEDYLNFEKFHIQRRN